jgi:hypothetical protein
MALHIGKIIQKRVEEGGMNKSEFARRINSTPQNVYSIFKRTSIDTGLLWEISRVLNYDFFQHYTTTPGMTSPENPIVLHTAADLDRELALIRREIELAAQENRYLKELVQLMRGKTQDQLTETLNTPFHSKRSQSTAVSVTHTPQSPHQTIVQPKKTEIKISHSPKKKTVLRQKSKAPR